MRRLIFGTPGVPHACGARLRIRTDLEWALYIFGSVAGFFWGRVVIDVGVWVWLPSFGLLLLMIYGSRWLMVLCGYVIEVDAVDDAAVGYRLLIAWLVILGTTAVALGILMKP